MTLSPVPFSLFSGSKLGYQYFRLFDVSFLCGLVTATKKDDQVFPFLNEIDSIARAPIYPVLAEPVEPLDV